MVTAHYIKNFMDAFGISQKDLREGIGRYSNKDKPPKIGFLK